LGSCPIEFLHGSLGYPQYVYRGVAFEDHALIVRHEKEEGEIEQVVFPVTVSAEPPESKDGQATLSVSIIIGPALSKPRNARPTRLGHELLPPSQ
jgi:hypothetical protein